MESEDRVMCLYLNNATSTINASERNACPITNWKAHKVRHSDISGSGTGLHPIT